ncbi:hypothetical protein [Halococcus sp. PRR34]|uniref:hypothetical protein n=1 Tax=Halococcus sp. PRR34 TaxID=3020830 RepID=UPI002362FC98|nr:hypothetical protein [Halococcus sp. PRR34]
MTLPHWFWCVRFQSSSGGGETLVVAPHPAAAKQSVAAGIDIVAFGGVEPRERVPQSMAEQRFDGYYPGVRAALDAGHSAVGGD